MYKHLCLLGSYYLSPTLHCLASLCPNWAASELFTHSHTASYTHWALSEHWGVVGYHWPAQTALSLNICYLVMTNCTADTIGGHSMLQSVLKGPLKLSQPTCLLIENVPLVACLICLFVPELIKILHTVCTQWYVYCVHVHVLRVPLPYTLCMNVYQLFHKGIVYIFMLVSLLVHVNIHIQALFVQQWEKRSECWHNLT